jgi:siroheme synthase
MAAGDAQGVKKSLLGAGMAPGTPVTIAESVSRPQKAVVDGTLAALPALAARCGAGPALVLLGEVFRELAAENRGQSPISSEALKIA